MNCVKCNVTLPSGAMFCGECGSRQPAQSSAPQPQAQPQAQPQVQQQRQQQQQQMAQQQQQMAARRDQANQQMAARREQMGQRQAGRVSSGANRRVTPAGAGSQPAPAPAPATPYNYSGAGGQGKHLLDAVVELIVANQAGPHHLWQAGWPGWKSWEAVPEVKAAVDEELATANEDPAKVAEYERTLHEMMADGVLEEWENEVLSGLREEYNISMKTHHKLTQSYVPIQSKLLGAAVDQATIEDFRAGQNCMVRLLVRNEGSKGLKHVRYEIASSATNGIVEGRSPRLAPRAEEPLMLRLTPELSGQHQLEGLLIAVGYTGTESAYRLQPFMFAVARAHDAGGTTVINQDFSAMKVGKISGVGGGGGQGGGGGLIGAGKWVQLRLIAITSEEVDEWRVAHGAAPKAPAPKVAAPPRAAPAAAPPAFTPPPAAKQLPPAPKPAPKPKVVYHYQGASGQAQHPEDKIAELVAKDPDGQHFLWLAGWPGWKSWKEVPDIANAVAASAPLGDTVGFYGLPGSLVAELCSQLATDQVILDNGKNILVRPNNTDIEIIKGVDGAALMRAGLASSWSLREGKAVAHTTLVALASAKRWDILAKVIEPLAEFDARRRVLEPLTVRQDHAAARKAMRFLDGKQAELAAVLFANAFQDTESARSQLDIAVGKETLSRTDLAARVYQHVLGDRTKATKLLSSWSTPENTLDLCRLARSNAQVLGDTDRARELLVSAASECADRDDALQLAANWYLITQDEKKVIRALTRVGDQDLDNNWELAMEAYAWKMLLDDDSEARSALARSMSHETDEMDNDDWEDIAPAWLNLFNNQRKAMRAMESWVTACDGDPDYLKNAARVYILLFDDKDEARALLLKGEKKASTRGEWQSVAQMAFWVGDQRRTMQALEKARQKAESAKSDGTYWVPIAKAWRDLCGDLDEAREVLDAAAGFIKDHIDGYSLARARMEMFNDEQGALRMMSKSERKCNKVARWVSVAGAWISIFGDKDEARRCLEAGNAMASEKGTADDWNRLARAWDSKLGDTRQSARCEAKRDSAREREKKDKVAITALKSALTKFDTSAKSNSWEQARKHLATVKTKARAVNVVPADLKKKITAAENKLKAADTVKTQIEATMAKARTAIAGKNYTTAKRHLDKAHTDAAKWPSLRTEIAKLKKTVTSAQGTATRRAATTKKNTRKRKVDTNIAAWKKKYPHWTMAVASDYTQAWCRTRLLPTTFIKGMREAGLWVTSMKHGLGEWMVVVSSVPRYTDQHVEIGSETAVRAFVKKWWNKDYYITDYDCLDDKTWAVVMTGGTGWKAQNYFWTKTFPKDKVAEAWKKKRNISTLCNGGTMWRTVVSTYETGYRQQTWVTKAKYTEMRDWIRAKWKESYLITHICWKKGLYGCAMDKNSGITKQIYKPCKGDAAAINYSKEKWDEGRRILEIGPDNDSWWLVFGKHKNFD